MLLLLFTSMYVAIIDTSMINSIVIFRKYLVKSNSIKFTTPLEKKIVGSTKIKFKINNLIILKINKILFLFKDRISIRKKINSSIIKINL